MIIPANPDFLAIYVDDENHMTRMPVIAWYIVDVDDEHAPIPITPFGLMPQPTAIQFPDGRIASAFNQIFDSFFELDKAMETRPALDFVKP